LAEQRFTGLSDTARRNIVHFYGPSPQPSANNRRELKRWKRLAAELSALRAN
jgi:hypothetical protein